jgi:hypothetical protein
MLPEWEKVPLPPGVASADNTAGALRCPRGQCGRITIVAAKAIKAKGGESAPCWHCFMSNRVPSAPEGQGSLL